MFKKPTSRLAFIPAFIWVAMWLFMTGMGLHLQASAAGHGTHEELGLPPCPVMLMFGRPCPGCGLTTSFTALLHGQFRLSFQAHPLGPFLYLFITSGALLSIVGAFRGDIINLSNQKLSRAVMGFCITFIIFGVARFIASPNERTPVEAAYAHTQLGLQVPLSSRK